MIILRCTNEDGTKADLDLFQNEELLLDISAIESGDIGQIFGVSSQNFALPSSKINNEFFGNLYNVSASPSVTFTKTVPCQVLYNGGEVFSGKLYLDNVVTDNQGNSIYNVVVVNETVDFKYLIEDLSFRDLDFSSLNHTYTYGNITGSWDQTLEDGAVFYPLINYGFDEDTPTDTQIKSGAKPRTFANYDFPLRVDDFKPAIRLRSCLDAIFDSVGYSYTSSLFTDGSYTDDIYMLATKDDKKGISTINPVSQSFLAFNDANQDYTDTQAVAKVNFNTELFDNGGSYNDSTSKFIVAEDGNYQFKIQFKYEILNYNNVDDARFVSMKLYKNGSPLQTFNFDLTGEVEGIINTITLNAQYEELDEVEVYVVYTESASGTQTLRLLTPSTRFELRQGPTTNIGGDVDLSQIYSDISVPEFLQGIIEKFNLVIEPVRNERNILRIETFDTWVEDGNIVDWTDKVDYSQKWEIRHPLQEQPKNIIFTDVEDNIALTQYHKRTTEKIYGEYIYESDSDLAAGEKTIGKFFAPTPLKGIDGAPLTVLPALAEKDDSTLAYKRTKFAPRLFYHNGRQDALGVLGKKDNGGLIRNVYYFLDESGVTHEETDYGLASHLEATPATFGTTRDLHFGNTISPGHYNYHQQQYNGQVKKTAFYEYWAFYLNELYDIDARKVTLNVILDPSEVQDIELNDKIFIDGQYYRIDKINGINLTEESSVQVTLLKTLPRKTKFPRRRIIDDLGVGVDITVDDALFSDNGTTGYVDYETDFPYTGSALPEAGRLDGFDVYDNTAVWNKLKPTSARFTAQTTIGLNVVDESAQTTDVRGDNNTIENSVDIARIEGSDNLVQNNATGVTIIGTDNTIEANVENSAILQSTTSSISENTTLSTIIGGEGSHISGSNKTVLIGQDLTVEGGNSNIVIGNIDNTTKVIKDLVNTTVINLNKDIESIENVGGDHYSGIAHIGTQNTVGAIYRDYAVITGSAGGETYLTGSDYADVYYVNLTWSGANGTHTLHLPSYAPGPLTRDGQGYKREFRFFTDNTLVNNSTIFRLDPSGSEVIDGTIFTEDLKRPLDGVTIFGTDSSWYTLQRKSK